MTQVNLQGEKTELSRPVRLLEPKQEKGSKKDVSKRIGIAKGKFEIPEDFDKWDKEVEDLFGGKL